MSFDAARLRGRARFDDNWMTDRRRNIEEPPSRFPETVDFDDDGEPLPSWPFLISRMKARLVSRASDSLEEIEIVKFFENEGPARLR
jgi:hypothetical protein